MYFNRWFKVWGSKFEVGRAFMLEILNYKATNPELQTSNLQYLVI